MSDKTLKQLQDEYEKEREFYINLRSMPTKTDSDYRAMQSSEKAQNDLVKKIQAKGGDI